MWIIPNEKELPGCKQMTSPPMANLQRRPSGCRELRRAQHRRGDSERAELGDGGGGGLADHCLVDLGLGPEPSLAMGGKVILMRPCISFVIIHTVTNRAACNFTALAWPNQHEPLAEPALSWRAPVVDCGRPAGLRALEVVEELRRQLGPPALRPLRQLLGRQKHHDVAPRQRIGIKPDSPRVPRPRIATRRARRAEPAPSGSRQRRQQPQRAAAAACGGAAAENHTCERYVAPR